MQSMQSKFTAILRLEATHFVIVLFFVISGTATADSHSKEIRNTACSAPMEIIDIRINYNQSKRCPISGAEWAFVGDAKVVGETLLSYSDSGDLSFKLDVCPTEPIQCLCQLDITNASEKHFQRLAAIPLQKKVTKSSLHLKVSRSSSFWFLNIENAPDNSLVFSGGGSFYGNPRKIHIPLSDSPIELIPIENSSDVCFVDGSRMNNSIKLETVIYEQGSNTAFNAIINTDVPTHLKSSLGDGIFIWPLLSQVYRGEIWQTVVILWSEK